MIRSLSAVRRKILSHHKKYGRHYLPWRKTADPYKILVSEIMLQQTQVDRVIPKFEMFIKRFPSVRSLVQAPLKDVLIAWQGLGYNRRGKLLQDAAKLILSEHKGRVPRRRADLEKLPAIGPYTAGAIRAFAFNEPDDFLETNIRTVLIHEYFQNTKKVDDTKLLKMLPQLRGKVSSRLFYSAMMDYGAYLKRQGIKLNSKSKHYTKQKPFKGSDREVRGAILHSLAENRSLATLTFPKPRVRKALAGLLKEGLISNGKSGYRLP